MPLTRPAPLESVRLSLARRLFRHLIVLKLVLTLVPRDHPWRIATRSALADWENLTEATLRPRGKAPVIESGKKWGWLGKTLLLVLVSFAAWAVVIGSLPV